MFLQSKADHQACRCCAFAGPQCAPGGLPAPPALQKLDFYKTRAGPRCTGAQQFPGLCTRTLAVPRASPCVFLYAKNPGCGPGNLRAGCSLLQKVDFAKSVPGPDSWASNISWALCHHRLVQAGLPLVCVCVCVCVSSSSTRAGPVAGRVDNSPKTRFCK